MDRDALICTETTHKFDDTVGPYPCGQEATHLCWTINGQWEPHCPRHARGYLQNDRARELAPAGLTQTAREVLWALEDGRMPGAPFVEALSAVLTDGK